MAKFALAKDLNNQGEFEEALALYQEALELLTEERFQYAMSMCACARIALNRGEAGFAANRPTTVHSRPVSLSKSTLAH